jgi:hypothetical protein
MEEFTDMMRGPGGALSPMRETAEEARLLARCRAEEEAAAQRAADIQDTCDKLDAVFAPFLKDAMAAENEKSRISARAKKQFEGFKAYCVNFNPPLPYLPACSQAVAAFLCKHLDRGPTHLARLARSISDVHCALNFPDPCADILVRGLLRFSRETPPPFEPQTQEGN